MIRSASPPQSLLCRLCALLVLAAALACPEFAAAALRYGQDDGLPSAQVQSLAMDSRGFLWVGTQDGVVRFDSHRFLPIDVETGHSPPDPHVRRMLAVPGAVYLATRSRLLRFDLHTEQLQSVRSGQGEILGVYALEVDDSGWIHAGTQSGQLFRWRDSDASASLQPLSLLDEEGQPWTRPLAINELASGRSGLWLATMDGVYALDTASLRLRPLSLDLPEVANGRVHVSALHEDARGALWVGFWNDGLARFSAFDEAIERQVPVDGRSDALGHPMVSALRVDRNDRLWIGTYGSGVHWVDRALRVQGQHWPLQRLDFGERRVESRFIWELRELEEGLLIGSGFGLFRTEGGRLVDVDPGLQSLRSSFDLGDGRLLIGSTGGLFLDTSGGREAPRRVVIDGHGNRPVWSIQRWRDEVWLGTDRGLLRLDETLRPLAEVAVGAAEASLPGPLVWVQKFDARGRLWLATSGGLVSVAAEATEPRFERQPLLLEAGVRSVASIEFDADGGLWLGSPRGLLRYHPQRAQLDVIDSQDGLLSSQQNAGASANDGERLYFGGIGGLVAFRPSEMPQRQVALHPAVVKWRLGQGRWRPRNGEIALDHAHAPLQVEFSAFHYARPERVRYAYRWLPAETEFTELGDAHSAVFSRLPAGQHRLELRVHVDGPRRASAEAMVLQVNVAAAWHQTLWARLLMAAAVVLAWFGFHRLRLRQARGYAQGLERIVSERTRELHAAKEALEQANARLRQQVAMDPLTGLANRRALFDAIEDPQQRLRRAGVLLIDFDHFKRINDRYGHAVGDAVLVDFAGVLQREVRQDCLCARYGGEEFLILQDDASPSALGGLAQRLVGDARGRRVVLEGHAPVRYTISIGVALAEPGEPVESIIQRADQALYAAKAAGRDRWLMAGPRGAGVGLAAPAP